MSTKHFSPSQVTSVRPSRGKGRGVFAARRIRAGDVIEDAPVLLVPKEQVESLGASFLGHYLFKSDNKKHLVLGLGFTSLYNHGQDANAEFFISVDGIVVKARRAIPIGAEITVDYGWGPKEWAEVGVGFPPS